MSSSTDCSSAASIEEELIPRSTTEAPDALNALSKLTCGAATRMLAKDVILCRFWSRLVRGLRERRCGDRCDTCAGQKRTAKNTLVSHPPNPPFMIPHFYRDFSLFVRGGDAENALPDLE
jgi:hypothetical protein